MQSPRPLPFLILLALPLAAAEESLYWYSDYKQAIEAARRTGKPIFLEYRCEP